MIVQESEAEDMNGGRLIAVPDAEDEIDNSQESEDDEDPPEPLLLVDTGTGRAPLPPAKILGCTRHRAVAYCH